MLNITIKFENPKATSKNDEKGHTNQRWKIKLWAKSFWEWLKGCRQRVYLRVFNKPPLNECVGWAGIWKQKLEHQKRREFVRTMLSNASSASLSPSLCPLGLGEMGKRRSLINLLHDFSHQLNTCISSYIETNILAFKNGENTLNILRSGILSFLEV